MKNLWSLVLSKFVAAALLVAVGLSIVILDFGFGSPVVAALPDPARKTKMSLGDTIQN